MLYVHFGYTPVSFYVVGEPTYQNIREFLLEAKANWEHTCIAGGLFLL